MKYSYNVYSKKSKAFCGDSLNWVDGFDNPDDAFKLHDRLNFERMENGTYSEVSYYVIMERESE